jgi:hypothetical protein
MYVRERKEMGQNTTRFKIGFLNIYEVKFAMICR